MTGRPSRRSRPGMRRLGRPRRYPQRGHDDRQEFGADGAFDPTSTRAALAGFDSPVLLLVGEVDINTVPQVAAQFAALFPNATFVVQPRAGHSPWLDDPSWFRSSVASFLDEGRPPGR